MTDQHIPGFGVSLDKAGTLTYITVAVRNGDVGKLPDRDWAHLTLVVPEHGAAEEDSAAKLLSIARRMHKEFYGGALSWKHESPEQRDVWVQLAKTARKEPGE